MVEKRNPHKSGDIGTYRLAERIAANDLAEVYRGFASGGLDSQEVAIKLFHPKVTEQAHEFMAELAEAVALGQRLDHENVARLLKLVYEDDELALISEYIPGRDLRWVMEQLRTLDVSWLVEDLVYIGLCVASAVQAAIEMQSGPPALRWLHYGLRPSNILLSTSGEVKVTDFFVGRPFGVYSPHDLKDHGRLDLLASTMSPEEVRGQNATPRSEVFSLGVILWELSAGVPLFQDNTTLKTVLNVEKCKVPNLREHHTNFPEALIDLIERMLAHDPQARPDMQQVVYGLRALLGTSADRQIRHHRLRQLLEACEQNAALADAPEPPALTNAPEPPTSTLATIPEADFRTTQTPQAIPLAERYRAAEEAIARWSQEDDDALIRLFAPLVEALLAPETHPANRHRAAWLLTELGPQVEELDEQFLRLLSSAPHTLLRTYIKLTYYNVTGERELNEELLDEMLSISEVDAHQFASTLLRSLLMGVGVGMHRDSSVLSQEVQRIKRRLFTRLQEQGPLLPRDDELNIWIHQETASSQEEFLRKRGIQRLRFENEEELLLSLEIWDRPKPRPLPPSEVTWVGLPQLGVHIPREEDEVDFDSFDGDEFREWPTGEIALPAQDPMQPVPSDDAWLDDDDEDATMMGPRRDEPPDLDALLQLEESEVAFDDDLPAPEPEGEADYPFDLDEEPFYDDLDLDASRLDLDREPPTGMDDAFGAAAPKPDVEDKKVSKARKKKAKKRDVEKEKKEEGIALGRRQRKTSAAPTKQKDQDLAPPPAPRRAAPPPAPKPRPAAQPSPTPTPADAPISPAMQAPGAPPAPKGAPPPAPPAPPAAPMPPPAPAAKPPPAPAPPAASMPPPAPPMPDAAGGLPAPDEDGIVSFGPPEQPTLRRGRIDTSVSRRPPAPPPEEEERARISQRETAREAPEEPSPLITDTLGGFDTSEARQAPPPLEQAQMQIPYQEAEFPAAKASMPAPAKRSASGVFSFLGRIIGGIFLLPFYSVVLVFRGVYLGFSRLFQGIGWVFKKLWSPFTTSAKKKEIPTFELFLSEDAGRPGPMERITAQSLLLMRAIQATIGVRFVLFIHAVDAIVELVTNYIGGIYQSWKMMKTVARKIQREMNQSQAQSLAHDLAVCRVRLGRLFSFSGFYLEEVRTLFPHEERWQTLNASTFPLHDILEIRAHLDEMERDLSLLNMAQASQFVKRSVARFLFSLIPNPVNFLGTWKNIFIMAFFMRYPRHDVEKMYADLVFHYRRTIELLEEEARAKGKEVNLSPDEIFARWMDHEEMMLTRLGEQRFLASETLQNSIDWNRRSIQRLMRVLCNPTRFVDPRRWPRVDLLHEAHKMERAERFHPRYAIELEQWLTRRVERSMKKKGFRPDKDERKRRRQEILALHKRRKWLKKLDNQHNLF